MELMSQRRFAKHIGRSNVWVSKLVKQGKLPVVDGKIPVEEGMKAYQASQQLGYEGNREYNAKQRKQKPKPQAKKATKKPAAKAKKKDDEEYSIPDDDEQLPSTGTVPVDKVAAQFNRAKLAEKTYQAKLKEMDYKEKQGLLIPREAVEADAANTAEELRGLLFSIPPRISPICEGKSARQIEALFEEALNDALGSLKKSRFTR